LEPQPRGGSEVNADAIAGCRGGRDVNPTIAIEVADREHIEVADAGNRLPGES
jgi:hypothetical protein